MNVAKDAGGQPSTTGRFGGPALARAELYATVFVTGAAVILIEILGTRVIGPVFGVSLFVWSALLAVTLGSLAVGYYAGGVLVDRKPTAKLLGFIVAAAGLLLACVPLLSHPLLSEAVSIGPRGGALFAATLLFAPSLAALGLSDPLPFGSQQRICERPATASGPCTRCPPRAALSEPFAQDFFSFPPSTITRSFSRQRSFSLR